MDKNEIRKQAKEDDRQWREMEKTEKDAEIQQYCELVRWRGAIMSRVAEEFDKWYLLHHDPKEAYDNVIQENFKGKEGRGDVNDFYKVIEHEFNYRKRNIL